MFDETFISNPVFTGSDLHGWTFHNLKRPCSVLYPFIKDPSASLSENFAEFESLLALIVDCNEGECRQFYHENDRKGYLPLRKQMENWQIRVSKEAMEVIKRGIELYDENISTHNIAIKSVNECGGYYYFYKAISCPDRFAAIKLDKYYNHVVRKIMSYLWNYHCGPQHDASVIANTFQYILKGMWGTWCSINSTFRHFEENLDEEWLKENGTLLKTGKVVRYLCPHVMEDRIEVLASYVADQLRGTCADTSDVLVSDTPSEVYTMPYRSSQDIASSCMRDEDENRFKIYDDIENCRIAYVKDGEYLIGRALLWDNVSDPNNGNTYKIMDKCYCKNRHILAKLLQYGKENGYLVKQHPESAGCYTYLDADNNVITLRQIKVPTGFELRERMYSEVPYLDTFCYAAEGDNCLTSYDMKISDELKDTGGEGGFLTGHGREVCCYCGERIDRGDEWWDDDSGEPYCETCWHNVFEQCELCGDWIPKESTYTVHNMSNEEMEVCHSCLVLGYRKCERCEEYFHKDRMEVLVDDSRMVNGSHEFYYCKECADAEIEEGNLQVCSLCECLSYSLVHKMVAPKTLLLPFIGDFNKENAENYLQETDNLVCPRCAKMVNQIQIRKMGLAA